MKPMRRRLSAEEREDMASKRCMMFYELNASISSRLGGERASAYEGRQK